MGVVGGAEEPVVLKSGEVVTPEALASMRAHYAGDQSAFMDDGFFEEDEPPETVARLAAAFAGPRRFVRDEAEMVTVVQTLRRQSERKVREEIVTGLKEHLHMLRGRAWLAEQYPERSYFRLRTMESRRAGLEEAAYILSMVQGFPHRGWSICGIVKTFSFAGHEVTVRGVPAGGAVGYEVECMCQERPVGWSVMLIGAKRLARRHAGLM